MEEEIGLVGAFELDGSMVKGRTMLNLVSRRSRKECWWCGGVICETLGCSMFTLLKVTTSVHSRVPPVAKRFGHTYVRLRWEIRHVGWQTRTQSLFLVYDILIISQLLRVVYDVQYSEGP